MSVDQKEYSLNSMRIYKELLSIELFSLKKLQNKSCIRKKKKKKNEKRERNEGVEKIDEYMWLYLRNY